MIDAPDPSKKTQVSFRQKGCRIGLVIYFVRTPLWHSRPL